MRYPMTWAGLGLPVPFSYGQLRQVQTYSGTRVVVLEGCGKDGHDLAREVTYWFDENDHLIGKVDPKDQV